MSANAEVILPVDVIKKCPRCTQMTYQVTTDGPRLIRKLLLDLLPIDGPNYTMPFFQHAGADYWIERTRLIPGADAYHAVHHCQPPARCKHCEQVHHNNNSENTSESETNMSEEIDWDQFSSGGTFVKFDVKGSTVSGTVTSVRIGTDYNGNPCPVIDLETSDGLRTITCGQANLRSQIAELKPRAGDDLTITYKGDEKAALGTKKIFVIKHDSGAKAPF